MSDSARRPAAQAKHVELSPPNVDCWIMPDLVGTSLHAADLAIKQVTDTNPVVRTASVDASGQGRTRISDSHWRVCWQFPEAGSWIRLGCVVLFHVEFDPDACADLVD